MHQRYMHWLLISWQSLSWWGDEINEAYSSNEELFAIIAVDELISLKDAQKIFWLARMGKSNSKQTNPAPTNGDLEIGQ